MTDLVQVIAGVFVGFSVGVPMGWFLHRVEQVRLQLRRR